MKIRIIKKPSWMTGAPLEKTGTMVAVITGVFALVITAFGVYRFGDIVFTRALDQTELSLSSSSGPALPPVIIENNAGSRSNNLGNNSNPPSISLPRLSQGGSGQAKAGNNFFADYRMERERTRGQQIELLREIVNNEQSSGETRKEAQKKLIDLTTLMNKEMEAEKLIVAKGYKDAVVIVQPDSVSVVVAAKELTTEERTGLTEAVAKTIGIKSNNIVVMTKE
ncbi:SpoIIIAH-like family protein [Heliobacterium chlorum]|uniref:SpoIIIAH-like family protein n=1 Tax=Heliobacterium chlorum TaxID=2698 RepID=A0ABR7T2B5_HELCL|nr:SpoIIIAH-like family protein [Heliobacterium chlorum]MBC9784904.1 SpoIIIAH-like family protein [Heliobacterium chlorum]